MKRKEFYDALYLAHHGIKGQKWGKRNGPPYPLDEENHSPSEQVQKKGLSDGAKRAIKVGAGIAVAALATYGAYKLYQSGALFDIGAKKASNVIDASKIYDRRDKLSGDAIVEGPLRSKVSSSLNAKLSNESDEQRLNNLCTLQGDERKNSCVQTALANAIEKVTGLQLKPNADTDLDGIGKRHIVSDMMESVFPQLREGEPFHKNLRDYGNTDLISSQDKVNSKLVELFGKDASGIIDTDVCFNRLGKYTRHAFNFNIKDGVVSYEDAKDHIEKLDGGVIFGKHTKVSGGLTICRIDNLSEINENELKKYISSR